VSRSALLVIDVQRGAFDGARCPAIARGHEFIARVRAALAAARAAKLLVVFVQHSEPGGVFTEGTPQFALHESVVPAPGDVQIVKRQSSSFDGTALADTLSRAAIREVLVCGLQSEHCVYNTAAGALARNLRTTLIADAHSTWPSAQETAEAISARVNSQLSQRGVHLCDSTDLPTLLEQRVRQCEGE